MKRVLIMEFSAKHVKVRFSSNMNESDVLILASHTDSLYEHMILYYESEESAMALSVVSGDRSVAEILMRAYNW